MGPWGGGSVCGGGLCSWLCHEVTLAKSRHLSVPQFPPSVKWGGGGVGGEGGEGGGGGTTVPTIVKCCEIPGCNIQPSPCQRGGGGGGKDPLPGPPWPQTPPGAHPAPQPGPSALGGGLGVRGWGVLRRTLKEAELDASLCARGSGTPARWEGGVRGSQGMGWVGGCSGGSFGAPLAVEAPPVLGTSGEGMRLGGGAPNPPWGVHWEDWELAAPLLVGTGAGLGAGGAADGGGGDGAGLRASLAVPEPWSPRNSVPLSPSLLQSQNRGGGSPQKAGAGCGPQWALGRGGRLCGTPWGGGWGGQGPDPAHMGPRTALWGGAVNV